MAKPSQGTLAVGLVALLLLGGATFFVAKAIKVKPITPPQPTPPEPTPRKKGQVIVGDLINEGIGQPSASWLATQPQLENKSLGLGETINTWLGKFMSGESYKTKTDLGLGEIKPTPIQTFDVKAELKKQLSMGYNPNVKQYSWSGNVMKTQLQLDKEKLGLK